MTRTSSNTNEEQKRDLTDTKMCVDGGVACRGQSGSCSLCTGCAGALRASRYFLARPKSMMYTRFALLAEPHEEVVRLHIPMDEVLGVDVLNAADLKSTGEMRNVETLVFYIYLYIKRINWSFTVTRTQGHIITFTFR